MERRVRSRLQLVPWKAVLLTHYFMIFVTWGIGNLSVEKGGIYKRGGGELSIRTLVESRDVFGGSVIIYQDYIIFFYSSSK